MNRKYFDKTKHFSFLIKDGKLSETYYKIWEKVRNFIKKIDNELLHNGILEFPNSEIWKTKIKYYDDKVNTKFYKKTPIQGVHCVWFPVVLTDSIFKIDKHFSLKIFL